MLHRKTALLSHGVTANRALCHLIQGSGGVAGASGLCMPATPPLPGLSDEFTACKRGPTGHSPAVKSVTNSTGPAMPRTMPDLHANDGALLVTKGNCQHDGGVRLTGAAAGREMRTNEDEVRVT